MGFSKFRKEQSFSGDGHAVVEIKSGGANLTKNQPVVYPAVQNGTAVPVGATATTAFGSSSLSTLPATPVMVLRKL